MFKKTTTAVITHTTIRPRAMIHSIRMAFLTKGVMPEIKEMTFMARVATEMAAVIQAMSWIWIIKCMSWENWIIIMVQMRLPGVLV